MGRIFLVLFLVLSVGACEHKGGSSDLSSDEPRNSSMSDDNCFYHPLPSKALKINVPFHFLNDRIYKTASGDIRRGVELEFLEGSATSTLESVTASMIAAGYGLKGRRALDDKGVIRQLYSKGEGEAVSEGEAEGIFVAVFPSAGRNPANPDAKGVLRLSWALPGVDNAQ